MSRELPVKLNRVITLFGIVSASIISLAILWVAFLPAFNAIVWHVRHGNKVSFDGHNFAVPAMWVSETEPFRNAIAIERVYGGGYIELTVSGQTVDAITARRSQEKSIAAYNNLEKDPDHQRSGTIIQGKTLDLVCTGDDDKRLPHLIDILSCQISNTNLTVSILTGSKHYDEVQSIIDTSH